MASILIHQRRNKGHCTFRFKLTDEDARCDETFVHLKDIFSNSLALFPVVCWVLIFVLRYREQRLSFKAKHFIIPVDFIFKWRIMSPVFASYLLKIAALTSMTLIAMFLF